MHRPSLRNRPGRGRIAGIGALGLLAALSGAAASEPDGIDDPPARQICTEPLEAAQVAAADGGEVVRLHWRLSGFLGLLAGLFVPRTGDALLTFVPQPDDRIRIEFLVTSPRREGEYYLYGAEVDGHSGAPIVIWNSEKIRDRRRDSETSIDDPQTIDYASAIYRLRWHAPDETAAMTIWDRGRFYSARVVPLGVQTRDINGADMQVRGYEIRGADDGAGKAFDDRIWLYFAQDDRSTPVEIVGKRGLIRARIEMVGVEGASHNPLAGLLPSGRPQAD